MIRGALYASFVLIFLCFGHLKAGNFVFVADFHQDDKYLPDGEAAADHCHKVVPTSPDYAHFGRFGCDPPPELIRATLDHAKDVGKEASFVVYGGDMAGHSSNSAGDVFGAIENVTKTMAKAFPGVPVYPSIGNDDCFPDYQCPVGPSPWYNQLSTAWNRWLGPSELRDFRMGGYYWTSPVPGLRVITLHTNIYSIHLNRGLYRATKLSQAKGTRVADELAAIVTDDDPSHQFAWLSSVLRDARDAGDVVYLSMHIPPGGNAYNYQLLWHDVYTKKFLDIVSEFQDIIKAGLYGHFHWDEMRYATDPVTKKPTVAGMIVPGISPCFFNNPGYRIVHYDDKTFDIIDFDTYVFDLMKSNFLAQPVWSLEYSFLHEYGMKSFSAYQQMGLMNKAAEDIGVWTSYAKNRLVSYVQDRRACGCAAAVTNNSTFTKCIEASPEDKVK